MISLLFAAALAFTPEDAAFAHKTAEAFVSECTPRDAGTIRGAKAANWILDRSSMMGADVRRDIFWSETPSGKRRFTNLYAEFVSNPSSRWVVVVSHYDTKPGVDCPGANDGAATSALLIALAKTLAEWRTPEGNVMLVWTDSEECQGAHYSAGDGLQGAERAVKYIQSKKRPIQAVLCLDMLGDRDLKISIPENGDLTLMKIARHAARRIGEPGLVELSEDRVKDDHMPFLQAGYRAIDLIDFEYGPDNSWWHTSEDTCDKISEESLLKSGRLVTEMLNLLL